MVDISTLKLRKVSSEHWKPLFEAQEKNPLVQALINRVASRVQDGINFNMQHWRLYYGIDQAWEVPLKQLTPTLCKTLANRSISDPQDEDKLLSIAKELDLSHLMVDDVDPKTGKPLGRKRVNLPVFFEVVFPLVRAYVVIRWAKLVNERNMSPLFKYAYLKSTPLNRARCEVITDRVEMTSTQYGYLEYLKQAVLRVLLYGFQYMFIQEEWHSETQLVVEKEGEAPSKRVVREGLRYHMPHPTRTYYDLAHPPSTLNTDTGTEFCGYWKVMRYGDLRTNNFWNKDRVAISSHDWRKEKQAFFNFAYQGCTLQFPQSAMGVGEKTTNDRESQWYGSDIDDTAVMVTEHFERLVPKECGLGDYEYPVWVRFVLAGDNTVLYAAPLPGPGAVYFGGDNDEGKALNSSLALEILPTQDQVGNLLTQALLASKQNLANLTFVNEDIVKPEDQKRIENSGERLWRKLNFTWISGKKIKTEKNDVREAFASVRFPQMDVSALLVVINHMLNMLERCIQTSAQEMGSYASHEQSAEEIRTTRQSTSNRVKFTGIPIDRGCDAWKRQIYRYLMAYGEEEIYAQMSATPKLTDEQLNKLGFTIEEHGDSVGGKHLVKLQKSALPLEYFASTREFDDRIQNADLANAMAQFLGSVFSNPVLLQGIGVEQSVQLMNQVLETMGLPRDFKLRMVGSGEGGVQPTGGEQQFQKLLVEFAGQVKKLVAQGDEAVLGKLAEAVDQISQAITGVQNQSTQNTQAIEKIVDVLEDASTPPPHDPTTAPADVGVPGEVHPTLDGASGSAAVPVVT